MTGVAIAGFKWWYGAIPTALNDQVTAVETCEAVTAGSAEVAGKVGTIPPVGESVATWNDPNALGACSVPWTILVPAPLPTGTVVSGYTAGSFTIEVDGGGRDVRADLSTTAGSATLVYQIDRTADVVTITPVDITTTAVVTASTTSLIAGARAKVFGVPQLDGSTKADAVFCYTRTLPADTIQSVLASGLRRSRERPAGGAVSRRLWVPGELPATEDV